MYLKVDVYSTLRPHHKYGSKGDEIKIIRDYENVLIVENTLGNRFPVTFENLVDSYEDLSQAGDGEPAVHPVVRTESAPVRREKKSDPLRSGGSAPQNSLF